MTWPDLIARIAIEGRLVTVCWEAFEVEGFLTGWSDDGSQAIVRPLGTDQTVFVSPIEAIRQGRAVYRSPGIRRARDRPR